jgi:hypothetical protein
MRMSNETNDGEGFARVGEVRNGRMDVAAANSKSPG